MIAFTRRRIFKGMKLTLPLAILLICLSGAALADGGYFNATLEAEKQKEKITAPAVAELADTATPNFSSVTTLDSCLKQLPEKDQIEVRVNYNKPYQECLRRASNIKTTALESIPAESASPKLRTGWKFLQVWKKKDKEPAS